MFPAHGKDFYKAGHKPQYPAGTQIVYSNMTARSNKHFSWKQAGVGYVVLFNISAFLQEHMVDWWETFFYMDKKKAVKKYTRRIKNSVGEMDCSHIGDLHDLGFLPVKVKSLPEGTLVPIGIPMFTVVNTKDEFFWVTNMLETLISCEMWKPITVATIAYEYRKLCESYARSTCDNNDHVQFQCHDFSMRGLSGVHDAAVVGSAHLTSFSGTDTPLAIDRLEDYYGADSDVELVGASVPATEHSVMCMGGKEDEVATVVRLLKDLYPEGIFSAVMDTWDLFKFLTEELPKLVEMILAREGKFVVRPDSGDPVKIITGWNLLSGVDHLGKNGSWLGNWKKMDAEAHAKGLKEALALAKIQGYEGVTYCGTNYTNEGTSISDAERRGVLELLWDIFGGDVNSKGYNVLDSHIGLIYGDSITLERADEILGRMKAKDFASSNVVFGVGSFTYQYITRDTFGMAIKATYGVIDGKEQDIQKDPATDDGTKKSLCGRVMVYTDAESGLIKVKDQCTAKEETMGMLKTVFIDGVVTKKPTLNDIRERISSTL